MARMNMIGAAIAAAAIVAGCCDDSKCKDEVCVSVDGAVLTRSQIDADVDLVLKAEGENIPADQLEDAKKHIAKQLAQQFLVQNILAKKATELGYTTTDEDVAEKSAQFAETVKDRPEGPKTLEEAAALSPLGKDRAMAQIRDGIAIDKMIRGEVIAKDTTDYAVRANDIISRIVAENEKALTDEAALAKITALKADLDAAGEEGKAAKFAELASANSDCPSGKKGGDLGEFTRGMMVREFEDVAFSQDVGAVSGPVKTQFGYHLIYTTGKTHAVEATDDAPASPEKVVASHILIRTGKPQEVPELSQVVEFLRGNANREKINDFMINLVRAAKIETSEDFKSLIPPPEEEDVPVPAGEPVDSSAE